MNTLAMTTNWNDRDIAVLWNNHYQCPHCDSEWHLITESKTAMDCPSCGVRDLPPVYSEDV